MSKVSCEAARKRRQAPLRMVRAELLHGIVPAGAILHSGFRKEVVGDVSGWNVRWFI